MTIRTRLRAALAAAVACALLTLGSPGAYAHTGPATATTPKATAATATTAAKRSYPKYGQHGAKVRALQNRLIAAGLLKAELNGGTFGPYTKAAIKKLQKRYGIKATGKMNARTDAALTKAVKAMTGPATWYHKETIGRSSEGRKIVAYRAGEEGKPVVMVVATMHGEENFGQYVARGLVEGRPITGVDLWVVPVLNPDGLAHDRRWIAHHVDLNRNFPTKWVHRANSGPRAKSGKETKIIMKFLDRVNPTLLVSWHQPLHGVDSDSVKNKDLMRALAKNLDLPKKALTCNGSCHGTMTQWFNAHHDGAAITVEYGSKARSMKRMKTRDADAVLAALGGARAA